MLRVLLKSIYTFFSVFPLLCHASRPSVQGSESLFKIRLFYNCFYLKLNKRRDGRKVGPSSCKHSSLTAIICFLDVRLMTIDHKVLFSDPNQRSSLLCSQSSYFLTVSEQWRTVFALLLFSMKNLISFFLPEIAFIRTLFHVPKALMTVMIDFIFPTPTTLLL